LEIDLTDRFEDRILGIDRHVAEIWGMIMARGAAASVRLPTVDTLIAATTGWWWQPAIFAISLMRQ
jgi:predicted nucleic acid-binding protein